MVEPRLPNEYLTTLVSSSPGQYRVVDVYDGDTIVVESAGRLETVRLIGVDTPESHDPRKPVQCYSAEAGDYTRRVLLGQSIRLEADFINANRDKYDRLLRYVYLVDGRLHNQDLIEKGYGFAYTIFPFQKLFGFTQSEMRANQVGAGLWSNCRIEQIGELKQTHSLP
jgi:micrococcal nuclease